MGVWRAIAALVVADMCARSMPPANALLPLPPLGYGRNLDEAGGAFSLINNINRTGVTESLSLVVAWQLGPAGASRSSLTGPSSTLIGALERIYLLRIPMP